MRPFAALLIAWMVAGCDHAPAPIANPQPPLTPAERAAPTLEATPDGPRLVQRALGFEMPVPDALTLVENDTELVRLLASNPDNVEHAAAWRWSTPTEAPQVIVILSLEGPMDPARQASFMGGMVEGARASFAIDGLGPLVDEARSPTEHVLHARATGGEGGMAMRFFAYPHGNGVVFASVTVLSAELDAITPIAEGARGVTN